MGERPSLGDLRKQMDAALKETVVPQLRALGFQGSYPHFRRLGAQQTDLLSFAFSNKWGGSFCILISKAPAGDYVNHNSEHIPAGKLTAYHLPFEQSLYLKPPFSFFFWFPYRFQNGDIAGCVRRVEAQLPKAQKWWAEQNVEKN